MKEDGRMWEYRARVERVVNGGTLDVYIDAGFRNYRTERLRVLGVDTPEMRGETLEAGRAALEFVMDWTVRAKIDPWTSNRSIIYSEQWPFIIRTQKGDALEWLADIIRVDTGESLADALIAAGHAVPNVR